MEWKHDNPYHDGDDSTNPGYLLHTSTPYCVTPGLSIAYTPAVQREDIGFASFRHAELTDRLQECGDDDSDRTMERTDVDGAACIKILHRTGADGGYLSLRSRTVTSSGFRQVMVSNEEKRVWLERQGPLWRQLAGGFGVDREDVVGMRARVESDRPNVLKEALAGLCSPGHSCKDYAKKQLKFLVESSGGGAGDGEESSAVRRRTRRRI